ncbi:hypothetical protein FRC19_006285 [Serendipita sp. 401]|nr:hypothetical protein FRC15_007683 [Serendipita sp. 397]KAG8822271.1 hypothetical protein FRC19_006285 [Serendipita sp. 401]
MPAQPTVAVGSIIIPLDVLNAVLEDLKVPVNTQTFLEKVTKHSTAPPTAPTSSQTRRDVHNAVVASLAKSIPPPTPAEAVVKRVDPSTVDPAVREKRRKLLADTRTAFNNEVPTPFVVYTWAGKFDNLQWIMAQIVVTSDDEASTQTFNEWCMWDTGAQITMVAGVRLDPAVKGGANAPPQGFLQAEITFGGVQTPSIQCSIGYRPQLPNNTQHIILGQRSLIECIEYSVTPSSLFPPGTVTPQDTYGSLSLSRYHDPIDSSIQAFN